MEPEDFQPYTLVQSYIKRKWFVSTALRRSSALGDHGCLYFETLAWEWDPCTKERGGLVAQGEAGRDETGGLREHFRIVSDLLTAKPGAGEEA